MSEQMRVAVIGSSAAGGWGHDIDRLFIDLPGCQVVAAADDTETGLAETLSRHGLPASSGFLNWQSMLTATRADIIAICPRQIDRHAEMALAAVAAGARGIFMEKPFVRTLAEADAIVAACTKADTKLGLALVNRHCPTIAAVNGLIADGKIGQLLELRARGKEDTRGGGEDLWVLGPHVLDLMANFGGEPQWCTATVTTAGQSITANDLAPGPEGLPPIAGDAITATFGLADGCTGYFASVREAGFKQPNFGITLLGTKGEIHIRPDHIPQAYFRAAPAWRMNRPYPWTPIGPEGLNETLSEVGVDRSAERASWGRLAVADLIDAIETDREPETGMFAGLTLTEMNTAIYAASLTGHRMTWPLDRTLVAAALTHER